jgi:hypothetical protein
MVWVYCLGFQRVGSKNSTLLNEDMSHSDDVAGLSSSIKQRKGWCFQVHFY